MKFQFGWAWQPVKDKPHYFKDVWISLYDPASEKHSSENLGVMAMDNFGELVLVRP